MLADIGRQVLERLDAELGGALRIEGTTRRVIPSGGFDLVRGRLDLLGKRFALTEGTLRLEGELVPVLALTAATRSDEVDLRIEVAGRADAPEIHFRSEPPLPEEEVVARLLFGRGLRTLSAFQAAQLASAVATLAGRGGEGLTGRLRQSFGLDDLDVTTGEEGGTAVRLGKYISRNIYADVVLGSGGTSAVNLNLDITPDLKARGSATAEGETSLGIFFERDY